MSIVAEIPGFLQVFSDGLVKRFAPGIVPASSKSYSNGFKFKDVTIDSSKKITARLSLPDTPASMIQLPVVVHFHGGCFCFCSTTWLGFNHFPGDLSVASQSIVLSVDYRLAPENRLPIGYDDCFSSLERLCNNASSDPWLIKQADLSPIISFWRWCWMKHNTPDVSAGEWSEFPAVVVSVTGLDFLNERGVMHAQFLARKGVKEVKLATPSLQQQRSEFTRSH
uniref:Alpha/beta hydrolase fold-3 domain-containing protein n=1 Tax=Populus trichocarpa TaxID=3694 RepID=A0A2K1WV01_POPTR